LAVASAPDFSVTGLRVTSTTIAAGELITIAWSDVNHGTIPTYAGWWDNIAVYNRNWGQVLYTSVFYDPSLPGNSPLAAGGTRERTFSFVLPEGGRGAGTLDVTITANQNVDFSGQLIEAAVGVQFPHNDNAQTITVQSLSKPYADLQIASFAPPASGNAGLPINVTWTVSNLGTRDTAVDTWTDQIVLTSDFIVGNADDIVLGTFTHSGGLAQNASYTQSQSITLPTDLNGNFRIGLLVDSGAAVLEPDTRFNSTVTTPFAISAAAADLAVEAISTPAAARTGDTVNFAWRVRNVGDAATSVGAWTDRVILSTGTTIDASSIALGDVVHSGVLQPGDAYTLRLTVTIPDTVVGTFNVFVVSDVAAQVFENPIENNAPSGVDNCAGRSETSGARLPPMRETVNDCRAEAPRASYTANTTSVSAGTIAGGVQVTNPVAASTVMPGGPLSKT
jgi:hypothetical protein